MFDILNVVDLLGIPRIGVSDPERDVRVVCPYCGDSRGKATVKVKKAGKNINAFHCWNCDTGRSMYGLYQDACGLSSREEAYQQLKDKFRDGYAPIPDRVREPGAEKIYATKAPADVMDETYRTMLSFLVLKDVDSADLKRRMLTEKEISDGLFRTAPHNVTGICRKLLKAGCTLDGVPGFFVNRSGEWQLNVFRNAGYFCPVFSEGKIAGMQIRLRNPMDGCKYIWLSSADKDHGVSSGSPASFFGDPGSERVLVTEGILKSYITYCMIKNQNVSVIGVPGISAIHSIRKILQDHSHKIVMEAYDMDKKLSYPCRYDYDVKKCALCIRKGNEYLDPATRYCRKKMDKVKKLQSAISSLRKEVISCGCQFKSYCWDRDESGLWSGTYKGIDDYLCRKRSNNGNDQSITCQVDIPV